MDIAKVTSGKMNENYNKLTVESLFVKWLIHPSLSTFDPRRFTCFTLCTIRISLMLLLLVSLKKEKKKRKLYFDMFI